MKEKTSKENTLVIVEYVITAKREINPQTKYRRTIIQALVELSKFHSNKKNFREMTREDILLYLDSFRKPDAIDQLHRWIGTYTLKNPLLKGSLNGCTILGWNQIDEKNLQ